MLGVLLIVLIWGVLTGLACVGMASYWNLLWAFIVFMIGLIVFAAIPRFRK